MKIIRKKRKGIKIEHNKTLFWIIIILIILLITVIYLIVKNNKKTDIVVEAECSVDDDCIPATCCHPTSCMPQKNVTVCNVFCTQVCSGPLDCGAGSCGCVKGKCQIVLSK